LATLDFNTADPDFASLIAAIPSSGEIDVPAWWNMGHKTAKFSNATLPADNLRGAMAFDIPIARPPFMWADVPAAKQWGKDHAQDANTWFLSLKSPTYPGAIDTALAEHGAILFHSKNLWAAELGNPVPKPDGGNGSCAGCHGAYSPRFVNDTAYLDTPALEGIAGYVVPQAVIGTDASYSNGMTENAAEYASKNDYFAYPETYGTAQDCTIQTRTAVRGSRALGYLAPPLYGVWATAPYFTTARCRMCGACSSLPTVCRSGGASQPRPKRTRPARW
jgi:hypothetical protein